MKSEDFFHKFKLNAYNWVVYSSMRFLSLEICIPLYEDIGLYLKNPSSLHLFIKNTLQQNESTFKIQIGVLKGEYFANWFDIIAQKIIDDFSKTNPEDYLSFKDWITNRFTYTNKDQPQWTTWIEIFEKINSNNQKESSWIDFRHRNKELLKKFAKALDIQPLMNEIERLDNELLTDWDLQMFALHKYTSIEHVAFLQETYKVCRFQKFIIEELPKFLPKDILFLNTIAETYVKKNSIEPRFNSHEILKKINTLL